MFLSPEQRMIQDKAYLALQYFGSPNNNTDLTQLAEKALTDYFKMEYKVPKDFWSEKQKQCDCDCE